MAYKKHTSEVLRDKYFRLYQKEKVRKSELLRVLKDKKHTKDESFFISRANYEWSCNKINIYLDFIQDLNKTIKR